MPRCGAAEGLEPVEGAFDGVAPTVGLPVERREPAAVTAAMPPVPLLIGLFGDRVPDSASSQVAARSTRAVCLVLDHMLGHGIKAGQDPCAGRGSAPGEPTHRCCRDAGRVSRGRRERGPVHPSARRARPRRQRQGLHPLRSPPRWRGRVTVRGTVTVTVPRTVPPRAPCVARRRPARASWGRVTHRTVRRATPNHSGRASAAHRASSRSASRLVGLRPFLGHSLTMR